MSHGAAILVAGALLISPGFLTDAIGFLLLVPAVRDRLHGVISRRFADRVHVVTTSTTAGSPTAPPRDVIDVEGWEVD
jgi:UPF0716 protein FxsA